MAVGEMHLFSRALSRTVTVSFYLPDLARFQPPYPGLLQLHGASDDHSSWFTRSKLVTYLGDLPFVVVTPDGGLSFWSNWWLQGPGTNYEDFLMQDLLPAIEVYFPVRSGRWAIGGLSMGGFGAMRLGLKYPGRFASIFAHSSVAWSLRELQKRMPQLSPKDEEDANLYSHAERALCSTRPPKLTFDCGVEDGVLELNRDFHAHLTRIGYPHEYREYPGGHTWDYWDQHVREALDRHAEVLGDEAGAR